MNKLALAGALALALAASPALAQKAGGAAPPKDIAPGALLNSVTADTIADINAGKTFFDSVKNATGSACYGALSAELSAAQQAAQPANGAPLPKLHLFYSFALGYQFVQDLQNSNSAISTNCAPLALQLKLSLVTLVNGLVTGSLTSAKIAALLGLP
jgi:hypothetical protein